MTKKYTIDSLNSLAKGLGSGGGQKYPINALNDISAALDGKGMSKYPADALDEIAEVAVKTVGTLKERSVKRMGYLEVSGNVLSNFEMWNPDQGITGKAPQVLIKYSNSSALDSYSITNVYRVQTEEDEVYYILSRGQYMAINTARGNIFYNNGLIFTENENGEIELVDNKTHNVIVWLVYDGDEDITVTWDNATDLTNGSRGFLAPIKLVIELDYNTKNSRLINTKLFDNASTLSYYHIVVNRNFDDTVYLLESTLSYTSSSSSPLVVKKMEIQPNTSTSTKVLHKGDVFGYGLISGTSYWYEE